MAAAGFRKVMTGIEDQFRGYLERERMIDGYLNRVIYKIYQNRQATRWMTENQSEGEKWKPLVPQYRDAKLIRYSKFPGAGSKTMIATGRLIGAVTGRRDRASEHKKLVEKGRLEVMWSTPYAQYTEDVRPVNEWDPKQDKEMMDDLATYLMKGIIRSISTIGGD